MANFNPGAWLSGNGAGTSPPIDSQGAKTMPPIDRASTSPPIDGAFTSPPIDRPGPRTVAPNMPPTMARSAVNAGAPSQFPWLGIDPAWVYEGGDAALRAQAMRKMRLRVAPLQDPQEDAALKGGVRTKPAPQQALWRWDEPFRVKAAVQELTAALVVEGHTLWWMPTPTGCRNGQRPQQLLLIQPPGPHFDYSEQIDKVLRAAVEREDRMPEILVQINDIDSFFDAITGIDRNHAPRLRELIVVAGEVATLVLMALKNNIAEWRPFQRSGRVQPVIATPGHGSLPSGHATISALTAKLLCALLYASGSQRALALDRLARRIAFHRVVAGLHFPMDGFVGDRLADQLAKSLVAMAWGHALPADPGTVVVEERSELPELPPVLPTDAPPPPGGAAAAAKGKTSAAAPAGAHSPKRPDTLWARLWAAAETEVKQMRI